MSSQYFTLAKAPSTQICEFLVREVIGFSDSDEYLCLDAEDRKSPGIVCGAFANYISKIYRKGGDVDSILNSSFNVIESLSLVQDNDIKNLVVTEILENIRFDKYPELLQRLKKVSKALYEQWLA